MTHPAPRFRLYRHPLSGHAHRVELFLSLLGHTATLIDVDLAAGVQRSPDFVARNPFAQVPVLEDGDRTIADSNAILIHLAMRHDAGRTWYPDDPDAMVEIQRWLSIAAGPLAAGPATARLVTVFGMAHDHTRATTIAGNLFRVLDRWLESRRFLVGDVPTIADVALYTYTAHAPEGGVALSPYPNIQAWLSRIEALPGFVPMPASPIVEAA